MAETSAFVYEPGCPDRSPASFSEPISLCASSLAPFKMPTTLTSFVPFLPTRLSLSPTFKFLAFASSSPTKISSMLSSFGQAPSTPQNPYKLLTPVLNSGSSFSPIFLSKYVPSKLNSSPLASFTFVSKNGAKATILFLQKISFIL